MIIEGVMKTKAGGWMIVEVLWRYLTKTTVRETSIQMEELRNT
jgi:hypothetical protein